MTHTIQTTISNDVNRRTTYVEIKSGEIQSTSNWLNYPSDDGYLTVNHPGLNYLLCSRPEWQEREYRQAYMEASIEQGVAWQIKVNRNKRGWTQQNLASRLGTKQSAIARLEDPEYGNHSLETLIQVAHAFDCALLVKFIPYSTLARESQKLAPDDLFAAGYESEFSEGNHEYAK